MTQADAPSPPAPTRRAQELRSLLLLAAPLSAGFLGDQLLGAVDTAVVGRLGALEVGAVGLGNSVLFSISIFGIGLMLGLDPLLSQAIGAKEEASARQLFWQGVWISLLVSAPLALTVLLAGHLLESFGINPASAHQARLYIYARLPSIIPIMMFCGARSYLQAKDITRPIVTATVWANLVNLPLSWLLVFGDGALAQLDLPEVGLPALGVVGAGIVSTICALVKLLIVVIAVHGTSFGQKPLSRRFSLSMARQSTQVGSPIGAQLVAEVGVFGAVAVLVGGIDVNSLAGHQIAITWASMAFMLPLGIGAATSVRVGQAIGRQDAAGTRRAGILGIMSGGAIMMLSGITFTLCPGLLASVLSDQPEVVAAAIPLLRVAAVFQISDGVQAVAAGALRGAGDTRWPLWVNLVGHYLIGLPVAVSLAFGLGLGAIGLWWGLSAGLTATAILLTSRFLRISSQPIGRIMEARSELDSEDENRGNQSASKP